MIVKVSDYIIRFIATLGVTHVFEVTGGAAMHLNDSLGTCHDIDYVCTLHEQAAAMAAESYAKATTRVGVCVVTAGPGGTNALTGVAGAWLDSTPLLVISGQAKRADLKGTTGVRQMGVQEIDIIGMVAPITKYAVTILDPSQVRFHLEKAVYLATTGRPGPVWLDLPIDVQGALIDDDTLPSFCPPAIPPGSATSPPLSSSVREAISLLNLAERPAILIGNGVRLGHARAEMRQLIAQLNLPVLTTWQAHDLVPDDHPLLVGRPGPLAPRGANFTVQNADWLLILGARLGLVVTGYAPHRYAPFARKIMVDIDGAELAKLAGLIDVPISADILDFIAEMQRQLQTVRPRDRSTWRATTERWKATYPVVLPEYRGLSHGVSTYVLAEALSEVSDAHDIFVPGSSGAGIEIFCLALKLREGQRLLLTPALGAMGNDLPSAIGACLATGRRRTLCVTGDGGIQLNIQELETIRRLGVPVTVFVLNNNGYASIRTSQTKYFGRVAGADPSSGVTLPSLSRLASAFGLPYSLIDTDADLEQRLRALLACPGPALVEVMTPHDEQRAPSLSSTRNANGDMVSAPLEDLWPFLDRAALAAEMIGPGGSDGE